ncbi:uncharacterized protein [Haliotis cracherodii]|uniref:uncharacterized protein n=1 Tax=Haliotis cracherodii TaxID=6455 RepID=UPI0039E955F2
MLSQMETLVWPQHSVAAIKGLHQFYCNQALCDVSLIAQDGTTFKAHQLLLAINSSFFHWVFHGWRETNERITEFKTSIEAHVLGALLSLIYQGEVKVPSLWPWKQKILEAATTLQFSSIVEALQSADRLLPAGCGGLLVQGRGYQENTSMTSALQDVQMGGQQRMRSLHPGPMRSGFSITDGDVLQGVRLTSDTTDPSITRPSTVCAVPLPQQCMQTGLQLSTPSCIPLQSVGAAPTSTHDPLVIDTVIHQRASSDMHVLQALNVYSPKSASAPTRPITANPQGPQLTGLADSRRASQSEMLSNNPQVSVPTSSVGSERPVESEVQSVSPKPPNMVQTSMCSTGVALSSTGHAGGAPGPPQTIADGPQGTGGSNYQQVQEQGVYNPGQGQTVSHISCKQSDSDVKLSDVSDPTTVRSTNIDETNIYDEYIVPHTTCSTVPEQTPAIDEEAHRSLGSRGDKGLVGVEDSPVAVSQNTLYSQPVPDAEDDPVKSSGSSSQVRPRKSRRVMNQVQVKSGSSVSVTMETNKRKTRSKTKSKINTFSSVQTSVQRTQGRKSKCDPVVDDEVKVKVTQRHNTRHSRPAATNTKGGKLSKDAKCNLKKKHIIKKSVHLAEGKLPNQKNLKQIRYEFSVKRKELKRASHLGRMTKALCSRYHILLLLKDLYLSQNLHKTTSQSYRCTLCRKDFKRFSTWRLHTISVHLCQKRKLQGQRSKVKVLLKDVKGQKKKKPSGECLLCTECGSVYSLRKTLKFHLMQVHHMLPSQVEMNSALLVSCEIDSCHFASIDYGELERHAKLEHPDVKYKCTHCQRPRMFHLKAMLDKHVTKVHGNKPIFSCTQCGQQFVKYVHQQEHERDQHGVQHSVKLFRCDVEGCEYETVRKFFLEKHKRIGHTEHKCPHCNIVVKTGDTLQNHIRTMHLNIRPFLCDICGMGFAKEPVLRLHVKSKHNQDKEYKCQHCPYGTNIHWYLANHVFHRHGVRADFDNRKELSCPHCNVKYLTNSYLQKHIRNVHDHTFKCTCDVCGKSYKSFSAMSTHRKIHQDGEQKCPYCDYSSKTGEHMKLHIRTQHVFKGMKPYLCPYCVYSSAMGGNVRKHVMHKHPGEEVRYNTDKEQILYMQLTEAQMERSSQDKGVGGEKAKYYSAEDLQKLPA